MVGDPRHLLTCRLFLTCVGFGVVSGQSPVILMLWGSSSAPKPVSFVLRQSARYCL